MKNERATKKMVIIFILLIATWINCNGQDTIKVESFDDDPTEWQTEIYATSGWTDSTFLLHGDGSNPPSVLYDDFTGFTINEQYVVSGRYKGGADLAVIVEGVVILTLGTATEWTTFRVIFTANLSDQKIEFRGGNVGHIELDNIKIFLSSGGPLAITLMKFNAHNEGDQINIKWSTADETNNDYFIIQRTSDGKIYKNIGEIKGAGTYVGQLDYHFVDENPNQGYNYYRLVSVDYDGGREYSDLIVILYDTQNEIIIYSLNGKLIYKGFSAPTDLFNRLFIVNNKLINHLK